MAGVGTRQAMVGPRVWRARRTPKPGSRLVAMSEARIERGAEGELRLIGVLDYSSGPALREAGRALIAGSRSALMLDCSAVERSSSVGLSLLLAFMRDAKAAGVELRVTALPDDMQKIAKVSGLLDILPLEASRV